MAAKKQPPAPRKPAATASTKTPTPNARAEVSTEELKKLISEAAYYRAKRRGFEPGHELEDWIQAEAEVISRMGSRSP